jgi:hypothetical protein
MPHALKEFSEVSHREETFKHALTTRNNVLEWARTFIELHISYIPQRSEGGGSHFISKRKRLTRLYEVIIKRYNIQHFCLRRGFMLVFTWFRTSASSHGILHMGRAADQRSSHRTPYTSGVNTAPSNSYETCLCINNCLSSGTIRSTDMCNSCWCTACPGYELAVVLRAMP